VVDENRNWCDWSAHDKALAMTKYAKFMEHHKSLQVGISVEANDTAPYNDTAPTNSTETHFEINIDLDDMKTFEDDDNAYKEEAEDLFEALKVDLKDTWADHSEEFENFARDLEDY
jgi:hypothetical protein